MAAKLTIFKIYDDCFTKRSGGKLCDDPEFETAMSNFMLCRILRMNDQNMWIAEIVNKYQQILSKRDFYLFVYNTIPKKFKAPFCDFLKKAKKDKQDEKDNDVMIDDDGYVII